ncbi:DUF11 domain-containing protein [Candidatus Saccharibacteria bacterium]|nr:DUF11 domain-containing protein [Candidatus Saccharibacteria bacterium]
MKKISNTKLKLAIATLSVTTMATIAAAIPASAWGPERPTFTMAEPATYPTFNSITDNPTIGDERDFVRVGEINAEVTDLKDEVEIIPGKQYLVYIYFHNNASATYNDKEHNRSGIAFQTRMSSSFSTVITPAERGTITGTITAENSNPLSVWDEAYMTTSTDKVLLHYVPGSAKIYNDWGTNGSVMASSLFTEGGTLLGLNALNGIIPGCEEYHGVVTYVLQAEELGGSISKTVYKPAYVEEATYTESAKVAPGDEIAFELAIANTGDVALTNAVVKDALPEGLTLISGSVSLRANDSATDDSMPDDLVSNGLNLGTIGTGNTVYINYRAIVGEEFACGTELTNFATLTYDSEVTSGDTKSDSASIFVSDDSCEVVPNEDPCAADPTLPGCGSEELPKEIVSTGPLEVALACIVVLGIAGAGFYLYRTRRALKTVENKVTGKDAPSDKDESTTTDEGQPTDEPPSDDKQKK